MRACAALNSPSPAFSAKRPPGGSAAIQTYSPWLLVKTVVVLEPLLHVLERLFVAQRDEQRIFAAANLAAEAVANRLEIVLRDIEPFVLLEEGLEVPDVVRRELHDRRRQRAQSARQLLRVAQVG